MTVGTIAVFGFCLVFLLNHQDTETQIQTPDGDTQAVYAQGLSDGAFNLLLVGLLVSFIIGTTSVIMLIRIRTLPPDQPSTPEMRNR